MVGTLQRNQNINQKLFHDGLCDPKVGVPGLDLTGRAYGAAPTNTPLCRPALHLCSPRPTAGLTCVDRVLAGQQRAAARRADRVDIVVVEDDAGVGQAVDVGGGDLESDHQHLALGIASGNFQRIEALVHAKLQQTLFLVRPVEADIVPAEVVRHDEDDVGRRGG